MSRRSIPPASLHHAPDLRRVVGARQWMAALALVVLLASTLGALHRTAHGLGHALGVPASTHTSLSHGEGFGHTAGSADCLVFDGLAHADAVPSVPALLPAVLAAGLVAAAVRAALVLPPRIHFRARAPPFFR